MEKLNGMETAKNLVKKINKKVQNVIPIDAFNNNHINKPFYVKSIKFIKDRELLRLLQEKNVEQFKIKYNEKITKKLSTNVNSIFKGDFFHLIEHKKHFNLIEVKNYHGIPDPVRKLDSTYDKNFSKTSESNFKTLNLINLFPLSFFQNKLFNITEVEKKEINIILQKLIDINPQELNNNSDKIIPLKNIKITKNTFLFIFFLFEFGYAVFFWLRNNYTFNKTMINLNEDSLKIAKINLGKLLHSFKTKEVELKFSLHRNYTYLQFISNGMEVYNFSLRSNKKPNSTIINNSLLKEELNISFKEKEYEEFVNNTHLDYIDKFNTAIENILIPKAGIKLGLSKDQVQILQKPQEKKESKTRLDLLKVKNNNTSIKIIFPSEFNKSLLEIIQYYFLITKNKTFDYNQLKSLYYDKNKKFFIDNYLKLFDNEIELQKFILSRISQNINPSVNSYFEKNGYKKIILENNLKFIIEI